MAGHMEPTDADLDNRTDYHPANTQERQDAHQAVRKAARELMAVLKDKVPAGRERSTALTKVEEAMFWGNAGIARQDEETA